MEVQLIIIVLLIVITLVVFKKFSNFIYAIGIIDIFMRIMTFIKYNINNSVISSVIGNIFPESIGQLIKMYSNGILETILIWGYAICYMVLLYYLIIYFIKKRK